MVDRAFEQCIVTARKEFLRKSSEMAFMVLTIKLNFEETIRKTVDRNTMAELLLTFGRIQIGFTSMKYKLRALNEHDVFTENMRTDTL